MLAAPSHRAMRKTNRWAIDAGRYGAPICKLRIPPIAPLGNSWPCSLTIDGPSKGNPTLEGSYAQRQSLVRRRVAQKSIYFVGTLKILKSWCSGSLECTAIMQQWACKPPLLQEISELYCALTIHPSPWNRPQKLAFPKYCTVRFRKYLVRSRGGARVPGLCRLDLVQWHSARLSSHLGPARQQLQNADAIRVCR